MFIPAISFSFGHRQVSPQSGVQQPKNDVQGLAQSLKAGDLAAAQKSFAAVQQGLQSVQSAQQSNQTTGSTNSTNPTISTDIQGLSQSLSSGDLTGAQKALAALQQDLQTAQASYGHHHHQQTVGASQAASLYANNGNSTNTTNTTSNTAVSSLLSAANAINVSA